MIDINVGNSGGNNSNPGYTCVKSGAWQGQVNPIDHQETSSQDSTLDFSKSDGAVKTFQITCSDSAGSSSDSVTITTGTGSSQTPTASDVAPSAGSLSITLDATTTHQYFGTSNPVNVVGADTKDHIVTFLNVHAAKEAIVLKTIALQMSNSSNPSDVTQFRITDGERGPTIGSGSFTTRNATVTLTSAFTIPKDRDRLIAINVDTAPIRTSRIGTPGALIQIDFDGNDTTGTQGIGVSSWATITTGTASADTATIGIRNFRAYPYIDLRPFAGGGKLANGRQALFAFLVWAVYGPVGVEKFVFRLATSTTGSDSRMSINNLQLYAYSDSELSPVAPGVGRDGEVMSKDINTSLLWKSPASEMVFYAQTASGAPTTLQIPYPFISGNDHYYFVLRGDVTLSGAPTSAYATTDLQLDAAYPNVTSPTSMRSANAIDASSNFIWTPNSYGTVTDPTVADFTNSFGLGIGNPNRPQTISYP